MTVASRWAGGGPQWFATGQRLSQTGLVQNRPICADLLTALVVPVERYS
jgi:hypothetical protein